MLLCFQSSLSRALIASRGLEVLNTVLAKMSFQSSLSRALIASFYSEAGFSELVATYDFQSSLSRALIASSVVQCTPKVPTDRSTFNLRSLEP